jgi:hypothetical protein
MTIMCSLLEQEADILTSGGTFFRNCFTCSYCLYFYKSQAPGGTMYGAILQSAGSLGACSGNLYGSA